MGKGKQTLKLCIITLVITFQFSAGGLWAACPNSVATVLTDRAQVRFDVEVAITAQEKAQGLMHRETMAERAGMLFVYDTPQPVAFWMRNTLIPLDMIFIDDHGSVTHVHHNAIPLDETPIYGGDAIAAVLEINAGLAKKFGISNTSRVLHPLITNETELNCK